MIVSPAWKLAALWSALILMLTSLPGSSVPDVAPFPHFDKLLHAGLYAVLGVAVARAAANGSALAARTATRALFGLAAFAALDEWHQRFIPGRNGGLPDFSVDVLGAVAGVMIFQTALARREIDR